MSLKVEKITEPVSIGEGPHWDVKQQVLYFVSINDHTIHKYVPTSGLHTRTKVGGRVGFIVPVDGTSDQFVVGVELEFLVIQWDGAEGSEVKVVRSIGKVDQDVTPAPRINDGKVDARGRLFAGTMGFEKSQGDIVKGLGSLFRLDGDKITKLDNNIGISNGLAWDLKEKAFYYIDTLDGNVRRYDYDVETGDISNKRFIFNLAKNNIEGSPDGATIDADGNLWVAVFQGSCVIKVDPITGSLLQKVPIPASQVTSVAFGGPDLDTLFVTTGSLTISSEQKPPSGSTFKVTGLGVKGLPSFNFKL